MTVHQRGANNRFISATKHTTTIFSDMSGVFFKTAPQHKENEYVDFDVERLIPYMLSAEGPKLALGDVNNDGKEDVFVGSAVDEIGKVLIQTSTGFETSLQTAFETDKDKEDAGAVFFDVDNDKDADLLVASGGYQFDQGSSLLNCRLYLNDGKGNFT